MRHINDFGSMILTNFEEIIKKENLEYIDKTNEIGSDVRLIGKKCEIQFLYDRGDLGCIIINPQNKRRYMANLLYKFLYPTDSKFLFSINDPINVQLNTYAEMIKEKLLKIIKGDFLWAEDFDRKF